MFRRIGRVVTDVRAHAAFAVEVSLGVYEALTALARGRAQIDAALNEHARLRSELPGF